MDGKMLARLGAIVFVSFAITATAIEMTRKDAASETERVHAVEPKRDALREGQRVDVALEVVGVIVDQADEVVDEGVERCPVGEAREDHEEPGVAAGEDL